MISVDDLASRRKYNVSFYLINHQIRISPGIVIKSYDFNRIPSTIIYIYIERWRNDFLYVPV